MMWSEDEDAKCTESVDCMGLYGELVTCDAGLFQRPHVTELSSFLFVSIEKNSTAHCLPSCTNRLGFFVAMINRSVNTNYNVVMLHSCANAFMLALF